MDENNNQTNNINNQELNNLANQNISENNIKQSTYNTTINETSSAHNPNTYNTQINGQSTQTNTNNANAYVSEQSKQKTANAQNNITNSQQPLNNFNQQFSTTNVQQTASMYNNQNIGANPQQNLNTNNYQMNGMNRQQVQSTPNQQVNSINQNTNQNTYNTQNVVKTQQAQNNNSQYNNINTNDKKAEFGTSQDGKIIASARKIKGEIIGGYFLVGIPLGIVLLIVTAIITGTTMSSQGGLSTNIEEISKKLLILTIPMSIVGVLANLLIVFLSSKITFKKRKVRRCDVPNVFKTLTIVLLIFGAISLFSSVSSYLRDVGNLDQQIKQMEKLNNIMSMYSSTQSSDSEYSEIIQGSIIQGSTEAINKMKSNYLIICIVGVICNIATTGLEILLQKKMLEKNAEG